MKTKISIILVLIILLSASFINVYGDSTFFLDTEGHWGEDYIKRVYSLGLISGYPDGTFKPNNTITRGEFTVLVMKSLGYEIGISKNAHWAKNYIDKSIELGIVIPEEFGENYDKGITRIQMTKMIIRTLGKEKLALSYNKIDTRFKDNADIPELQRGYIIIASELGIINGYPDNTFKPNNTLTRAETTVVILKMLQTPRSN